MELDLDTITKNPSTPSNIITEGPIRLGSMIVDRQRRVLVVRHISVKSTGMHVRGFEDEEGVYGDDDTFVRATYEDLQRFSDHATKSRSSALLVFWAHNAIPLQNSIVNILTALQRPFGDLQRHRANWTFGGPVDVVEDGAFKLALWYKMPNLHQDIAVSFDRNHYEIYIKGHGRLRWSVGTMEMYESLIHTILRATTLDALPTPNSFTLEPLGPQYTIPYDMLGSMAASYQGALESIPSFLQNSTNPPGQPVTPSNGDSVRLRDLFNLPTDAALVGTPGLHVPFFSEMGRGIYTIEEAPQTSSSARQTGVHATDILLDDRNQPGETDER